METEISKFLTWAKSPEAPADAKKMAEEITQLQTDYNDLLRGARELFEALPEAGMLGVRLRLTVQRINARSPQAQA